MLINLQQLKQDIEDYPAKLQQALLNEALAEDRVESLQEQIDELQAGNEGDSILDLRNRNLPHHTSLHSIKAEDTTLRKLQREFEVLRNKKTIEVMKDPEHGITSRTPKHFIDTIVSNIPEVQTLQQQIWDREELLVKQYESSLQTQSEPQDIPDVLDNSKEIERLEKETEKAKIQLRKASVERQIIEDAWPRKYHLLLELASVERGKV
ncbi:MAG: hypothetical protein JO125_06905 [Chloroflexi bacterium]|nr:hypothetical protein [Ktedonobacteraceae bacterium]MBV9707120.1 hypothetical protein [Chloroflexota bacterium]